MVERLQEPAAARAVYEYLEEKTGKPAGGLVPNPRPNEFIRVRTGGGAEVDVAAAQRTVFVECYARKVEDAETLSRECDSWIRVASLDGWLLDVPVRSITTISLPQELPDPLVDLPRFTATYAPILQRVAVTVP